MLLDIDRNFTDTEELVIGLAYKEGIRIGKTISEAILDGRINITNNETLTVVVNWIFEFPDFPLSQNRLTKLGSSLFLNTGNVALASGGLYIAGMSTQNYLQTNNKIAKLCYGASICCSSTAVISGTLKAYADVSGLSYLAMWGDAFGTSFLCLGNRARDLGKLAESKTSLLSNNPFERLRNRAFRRRALSSGSGSGSLAFLTGSSCFSENSFSEVIMAIPYQKIILVGGSLFTVYTYGKVLISTYRYGQKLVSKYRRRKQQKKSKLLRKQCVFLINSLMERGRKARQLRIYKFAISYPLTPASLLV